MKETLKANIKLKQCKICENLECSDNEKFIDMFSDLSIIADLNFTTGIITVNIPNLSPSLICSSCLIQLRSFADFKRKALESEENFRTRNSKIEKKFWEDERTTFYEEQEIFDDEISSYNPIFFIKEEPEFFSQDSESLNCINFVDENYESDDSVKSAAKIDTQCEKCGKMFKCMQIHSRLYHSSEDGKNEFDERNFCKLLELNSIENGVGLIRLLQNTGAIPEAMRCKKCKNFMKIRKNGNFYKWCCNMIVKGNKKAPRRCNYSQSLTSSTFFSGSHLSILQVCMFTELWIQNIPLVFIKEEVEITQKTAIYWSSFCREVCFDALIEKTQTSVGGEEKVVEIYESIFGHRKYNHRKRIEGQWVFGILERDTGNTILVPVDNRDHDTLFPIIQDYILPGTTIISDYWKSYDCLNSEEYTYLKVNHNVQFKDPVKGANTNKIESIWRAAKSKSDCLSSGRRKKFFAGYMAKYMFLKKCRIQNLDPFIEFMKCAGQLYDGVPHTLETNESNEDESDEEESFLM